MKNDYHVIISNQEKRMLGEHIWFMAQASRETAGMTKYKV